MTYDEQMEDLVTRRREFRYAIGITGEVPNPKTREELIRIEARLTREIEDLKKERCLRSEELTKEWILQEARKNVPNEEV